MLPVGPSMIVQCDKCKTKFRIADNKINDTGVKVRCSRCAHVFVVRADVGSAIPHFHHDRGPDTARVDAMSLASLAASSQPSAPDPPTWTGIPGARTEQSTIPGLFGGPPRATAPSFPPPAHTSSEQLAAVLGFAGAPPPAPPPLPPGADFSEARTIQTHVKAPPQKARSDAHLPSFPGGANKTPSGAGPPPMIPKPITDPDPSIRFPPPPDLMASLEAEEPGGAATEMSLPGVGDDFIPPEAFSADAFPPPPPSTDLAPFGEAALPEPTSDDPFANVDIDGPKSAPNNYFAQAFDAEANRPTAASEILARIDLAKTPNPRDGEAPDPFGNLEETAHGVDAKKPKRPRARATTVPALPQLEHRTRRWPTVLGVTVGAAFALFVYPGLADGVIQAIEGRTFAPLFETSSQGAMLPDGVKEVRAIEPMITRYPIASKSGILVVSGRVENESSQPLSGLEAVVLVMDGDQIKDRQAAPVGVMLDPRVLSKIVTTEDLGAAWATAKGTNAPKPVDPGEARAFMVVFPQAAEDFETRTLRVEFVKAGATTDAR